MGVLPETKVEEKESRSEITFVTVGIVCSRCRGVREPGTFQKLHSAHLEPILHGYP